MYIPGIIVTATLVATLLLLGVGGAGLMFADSIYKGARTH